MGLGHGLLALLGGMIILALTGCSNAPTVAPVVSPAVNPVPVPAPLTAAEIQAIKLGYLLDEAEAALRDERLLLPAGDNALMWFKAALAENPDNLQAKSGIQQIMVHYAQWIRESLAKGKLAQARQLLATLEEQMDVNPLLEQLQQDVVAALGDQRDRHALAEDQWLLPVTELNERSENLSASLQAVALKAREGDQMLLIKARNDAEGRWIYQQMREAVSGYRLRADIEQAMEPAIVILPSP